MKKGIEHATRLAWSAHGSVRLSNAKGSSKCGTGFVVRRSYGRHVLVKGRRSYHEMPGLEQSFVCEMMVLNDTGRQRVGNIVSRSLNGTRFAMNT